MVDGDDVKGAGVVAAAEPAAAVVSDPRSTQPRRILAEQSRSPQLTTRLTALSGKDLGRRRSRFLLAPGGGRRRRGGCRGRGLSSRRVCVLIHYQQMLTKILS